MNRLLMLGWLILVVIPNFVYAAGKEPEISEPTKTLKIYGPVDPTALLSVEDCSTVKCINDNREIEGNKKALRYLNLGTEAFIDTLRNTLEAVKKIIF